MKRKRLSDVGWMVLVFSLFGYSISAGAAPDDITTVVDLQFQENVTPIYESYLSEQEIALAARIGSVGNSDAVRSDRMALILVKLAQIHVEMDYVFNRLETVSEDLEVQWEELEDLVQSEVLDQDTENMETVLNGLRELFLGLRYEELKGRVETVQDSLESDADQVELILNDFQKTTKAHLDVVRIHLDVLKESEGNFNTAFTLTGGDFRGDEVFEVSRGTLNDIDVLKNVFQTTLEETEKATDLLRKTLEGTGGDNLSAIASLRIALGHMNEGLDTLITALDEEPLKTAQLTLTQLDDIRWNLHDLQDLVVEADSVLAGRTYELEGTIVRPVALIENFTENPEDVFLDFYRSPTPDTYTFRGFFPNGLPEDLLDILSADMVLNPTASWEETDIHMRVLQNAFEARVNTDRRDAEANAGLALTRIYFLTSDNRQKAQDLVNMAQEGDISGIAEQYDVEDFDYQEALDSTRTYLDVARQERDLVFTVLFKLNEDPDAPFDIDTGDRIVPIPMTGELLGDILDVSEQIGVLSVDLAEAVQDAFNEANESFELDLDPNLLDFTDAKSGLDFARALERSNDQFFWITPKGTERLTDLGNKLQDQLETFSQAATSLRKLAEAVHDRDADLHLETETVVDNVRNFEIRYQEIQEDFETPGATTDIDGMQVNLSAWLDEPPDSLIQRFIWYLDDDDTTDNTLGGLFPVAKKAIERSEPPQIPPVVTGPVGPIALDLDLETGDQGQRQTIGAIKSGDTVTIDISAISGAQGAIGFQAVLTYDPAQLEWMGFTNKDLFADGAALPATVEGETVTVNVAILGGQASGDSGSLGHAMFRVLDGFSGETRVQLTSASYNNPVEVGATGAAVTIGGTVSVPEDPVEASDFSGDGKVDFSDFLTFAQNFGKKTGDADFNARIDLDSDGTVGFSDFLIFAQNFGKKVGG